MASLLISPPLSPCALSSPSACLPSPRPPPSPAFGGAPHSHPPFHFPLPSSSPLLLAPNPQSRRQERTSPVNVVRSSCATAETCEQLIGEPASLYAVLGVGQNASASEIKSAYRQMARLYHPDVCAGSDRGNGSQKFLQVREAYDILSDPDLRSDYDYSLLHPFSAQALGRGFTPSSMDRRRRGESSRSDVSGAWKLQWEAQLNRLRQEQDRGSFSETWGEKMRRRNQENSE